LRIALDAMGGDYAPAEVVKGALEAARERGLEVALVGPREVVEAELAHHPSPPPSISLVHASQVIAMDEHPALAARQKKDSSIVVGLRLLKTGEADAFVSAGNTGAVVAAAIFYLGRIKGIERPALAAFIPTGERLTLFLDVGANADCKPHYLLQFARMGSIYMERGLGIPNPRVALLNIGEEASKGSQLAQESYALLQGSGLNFIGNVEGKDIPRGLADVIVTDGFTGNVVVKTMEGVAETLMGEMRAALTSRLHYKLAALILRGAFGGLRRRLDWAEYGAGPLLGIDGLVFIAHGRSKARAIRSALRAAARVASAGTLEALRTAGV